MDVSASSLAHGQAVPACRAVADPPNHAVTVPSVSFAELDAAGRALRTRTDVTVARTIGSPSLRLRCRRGLANSSHVPFARRQKPGRLYGYARHYHDAACAVIMAVFRHSVST